MRVFRDPDDGFWEADAANFAIGAVAGLAIGILLSRGWPMGRSVETVEREVRQRAGDALRRLRPGRLHRLAGEQEELDSLEDVVLRGFLGDEVLGERPIDIGAISLGIVELSGTVKSQAEAQRAVGLANGIAGVRTVVNRLEVKAAEAQTGFHPRIQFDEDRSTFGHQEGRVGGMGRRRQGFVTEPDRPDDSQKLREEALAAADRQQWREEIENAEAGLADTHPDDRFAEGGHFREDELDNQDPHGKSAAVTFDSQPQELNTTARVGEKLKSDHAGDTRDLEVTFDDPSPRDTGG